MLPVACQIQYAKANYPTTLSWKARLFVFWLPSLLLSGDPATGWQGLVVSAFTAGLIGDSLTFWAPITCKTFILRNDDLNHTSRRRQYSGGATTNEDLQKLEYAYDAVDNVS